MFKINKKGAIMLNLNTKNKSLLTTIYISLYLVIYTYFYILHWHILPNLSSTFAFSENYIWIIRLGYFLIGMIAIWFYLEKWVAKKVLFIPKLIIKTSFLIISTILFLYAYIPGNSGNIVSIFIGYLLFGIIHDIYTNIKNKEVNPTK